MSATRQSPGPEQANPQEEGQAADGIVSRQRIYQRRRKAQGLCVRCGKGPLATNSFCERCRQAYNAEHRKWYAANRAAK